MSSTAVASLSVDPGSYVFIASARLRATDSTATNAECYIASTSGNSNFSNVGLDAYPDRQIVSLNYAVTLASATTMKLYCDITGGGGAAADEVFFTAIQVGSVTQQ